MKINKFFHYIMWLIGIYGYRYKRFIFVSIVSPCERKIYRRIENILRYVSEVLELGSF